MYNAYMEGDELSTISAHGRALKQGADAAWTAGVGALSTISAHGRALKPDGRACV